MIFSSQLKFAVKRLFGEVPREVSLPWRVDVTSRSQIYQLVSKHHYQSPVFSTIYSVNRNGVWAVRGVDKVFFDVDNEHSPAAAQADARALIQNLEKHDIPQESLSVVYSGKKGWHIYTHFNSINKNTYIRGSEDYMELKHKLRRFSSYMSDGIGSRDMSVAGDLMRPARIPGATRPDTNQPCLMMPVSWVLDYDIGELLNRAGDDWGVLADYAIRYMQKCDFKVAPFDFLCSLVSEDYRPSFRATVADFGALSDRPASNENGSAPPILRRVKEIIGEKLAVDFFRANPLNSTRVAVVYKLFESGLEPNAVLYAFARLDPYDYDPDVTQYHVEKIWEDFLWKKQLTEN